MVEGSNDMDRSLFSRVDEYIKERVGNEDEILREVKESCRRSSMPHAEVSSNQGKFLQILARSCGARRILELGTLVGFSTIWLARALDADGQLITVEFDAGNHALALENLRKAGLAHIVEARHGKALEVLHDLIASNCPPFDFIFIDADKPPYLDYLRLVLRLSRPGTLIVLDNVIRNGAVLDPDSRDERVLGVQRLNDALKDLPEADFTILPTVGDKEFDGMAIGIVRLRKAP